MLAHGFSQAVNIAIQLLTVPIFLKHWGVDLSGEWLLLSTLPAILAMSDLSLCTAAGTEMTLREASNDREGALKVFHGTWTLICILSFVILAVGSALIVALPWTEWFNFSVLSISDSVVVSIFLLGYVVISQQIGLLHAGYRATESYATGITYGVCIRIAELIVTIIAVAGFGGTPVTVASCGLIVRLIGAASMLHGLRCRSPWINYRWDRFCLSTVRPLIVPALSFTAFPIGHAISLQGAIALVSLMFGPASAMLFSTTRTLSRLIWQLINALSNTVLVEVSLAFGANDLTAVRNLHRKTFQVNLWVGLTGAMVTFTVGPEVYRLWTGSKLSFDVTLLFSMVLLSLIGACWGTSYVVPMAINRHKRVAVLFLVSTIAAIVFGYVFGTTAGLVGVVAGFALSEAVLAILVLREVLAMVGDDWISFGSMVLRPPTWLFRNLASRRS